jgi:hypothetical protein
MLPTQIRFDNFPFLLRYMKCAAEATLPTYLDHIVSRNNDSETSVRSSPVHYVCHRASDPWVNASVLLFFALQLRLRCEDAQASPALCPGAHPRLAAPIL